MIVYFDASAFVKLLVEEPDSDLAETLWDSADVVTSSRIANAEVRATLAAAARSGRLSSDGLATAKGEWRRIWQAVRPVELVEDVDDHAGDLAESHALSGADALHLASALVYGAAGVIVATWDIRLRDAARAEGSATAPS